MKENKKMNTKKPLCFVAIFLILLCPVPSIAEITFYVSPDGDKAFFIEGDDIGSTQNIAITITYDSTILANPHVTLEGGTVTNVANTDPGTLTFNASRQDALHSFEAHVSFDRIWDGPGGIFSVTGEILDADGTLVPSHTTLNMTTPALFSATPQDDGAAKHPEQQDPAEETAHPAAGHDLLQKTEKSVLQRFREFKGTRSVENLVALFDRGLGDTLVQDPPVALSDGETVVSVKLFLQQKGENALNVAMLDAKLLQVRKENGNRWLITALPNKGTWNAGMIIQTDEKLIEFPLAVAPKVKMPRNIAKGVFLTELDRFISEQARSDKGGSDPLRHSLYEYFFTANYLAGSKNHPSAAAEGNADVASTTK
jgi:hypothetical protein